MGIFSWLFGRQKPAAHLPGPGDFAVEVVGESNYQSALDRICGGRTKEGHNHECTVMLVLEDDNPHDKKAVRVDVGRMTVGYLSRPIARQYRRGLEKAGYPDIDATVDAVIKGGWKRGWRDKGNYGVLIDLPYTDT